MKSNIQGERNLDEGEIIDEIMWVKISDLDKYEFSNFQKDAKKKFIENYFRGA